MNESIQERIDSTLARWVSERSLLRIIGGAGKSDGVGFDTLCRIKDVSSEQIVFEWADGISWISLIGFSCGFAEPEGFSSAESFSLDEEYVCQLQFGWPSGAKALISELRLPS